MAFATANGEVDASLLEAEVIELLRSRLAGWEPAEGDLESWLIKGFSRIGSQVFGQASELEEAAFKRYGEAIVRVPPVQAAAATVESTWEMVDDAGYPIPDGTRVLIEANGAQQVGFVTVGAVEVAPGSTKATVLLRAIETGTAGNGLTGPVTLSDALSYVVEPGGITLAGSTSGGVDEEEESAYLNRLVEAMRTLSLSLILPEDFEIDSRAIAGIARCKCIRNYNAETKEDEIPLCLSVFPIDAEGNSVTSEVQTKLKERQEAKLLSGILYFVGDAQQTEVDVTVTGIVTESGFNLEAVEEAVKTALTEYLASSKWGLPKNGEGSGWINRTTVYRNSLIAVAEGVGGVDHIGNLELAKHGSSLGTKDVELEGVAPLAKPGTITVSE